MSSIDVDAVGKVGNETTVEIVPMVPNETKMEYVSDIVLGVAFVCVGVAAAQR